MSDELSDVVIETAKSHKDVYVKMLENEEISINELISDLALCTAFEHCYSKCFCLVNLNPVRDFMKDKVEELER